MQGLSLHSLFHAGFSLTSSRVSILLVEDEESDAELALRALSRSGLNLVVQHVRDGEEALNFIFGRGPFEGNPARPSLKAVFLDLKLPKVDGLEVLRAIKADPQTRSLPVIILTSSMLAADVEACYTSGANSFVVKQVEFGDHSRVLKEMAHYWTVLNIAT